MTQVIIIDDEPLILQALKRVLRRQEWQISTFEDPEEALAYAAMETIDLALSDYRMPGMDGITFLKELKAIQPDTFRIVLSGQADMEAVLLAINQAEIYRFITKPWNDAELRITLEQAIRHREMLLENRRLADLVRSQQAQIDYQTSELERLEAESPGITRINWGPDGSILIDERDLLPPDPS